MGNPANILILGAGADDYRVGALETAGYRCTTEPVGTDILAAIDRHRPIVALVSIAESEALESIRTAKVGGMVQGGAIAAFDISDAPDILARCRGAGVDDVFEEDTDRRELVARMRALVRLGTMESELIRRAATAADFGVRISTSIDLASQSESGHLLVVGVEEGELDTLCPLLSKSEIPYTLEPDPYRARSRIEGGDRPFDGVLVYVRDEDMREKCSYFCRSVRNDTRLFDLPLILVTEHGAYSDPGSIYDEGANVVAATPVDSAFLDAHLRLLLRGRERRRAIGHNIASSLADGTADDLGHIFSTDFTRAHIAKLGKDTADRGIVSPAVSSFIPTIGEVAAIYGTEEANLLRKQLASWLAALVRVEDTVGRSGADEFVVLMPGTGWVDADHVRKRVVGILHQSEFRLTDNMPIGIDVYVRSGVTELQESDNLEDMVSRASDTLV
jgi:two-component system cell cycle response regulator